MRQGVEPEFTNYAQSVFSAEAFKGTLDYLWLSSGLRALEVLPLPSSAQTSVAPHETEPSDHWMVAATVAVPVPASAPASA
jgi:hypothetical protein